MDPGEVVVLPVVTTMTSEEKLLNPRIHWEMHLKEENEICYQTSKVGNCQKNPRQGFHHSYT